MSAKHLPQSHLQPYDLISPNPARYFPHRGRDILPIAVDVVRFQKNFIGKICRIIRSEVFKMAFHARQERLH